MERHELCFKEIQANCLEILREFDAFAKAHNLRYFMSGGTLLGAVRHKGFIPWDDDVDLMMPRADYERLLSEYEDGRYILSSCDKDPTYYTPFARLWDSHTTLEWHNDTNRPIGIFIDIFPIDGYPANELYAKLYLRVVKYQRLIVSLASKEYIRTNERHRLAKECLSLLHRRSPNYYARKMNAFVRRKTIENSRFAGVTTTKGHILRERNPRVVFDDVIYMEFEGMKLPAPVGYDAYLRQLYAGDYMQLPPEDKRVSKHNWKAYRITD